MRHNDLNSTWALIKEHLCNVDYNITNIQSLNGYALLFILTTYASLRHSG